MMERRLYRLTMLIMSPVLVIGFIAVMVESALKQDTAPLQTYIDSFLFHWRH
jgi:hypothetical protein